MSEHQQATSSGKARPPTASTKAYRDAATKLQVAMSIDYTGDADKDFAALLAAYGGGAAAIARLELEHGSDPAMRRLAEQVVHEAETQATTIKTWQGEKK